MKKYISLLVICTLQISVNAQGESSEKGSLDKGTIKSQYDYIWESSNKYQDHRVVKAFKLNKFKNNVLDSLSELHVTISELRGTLSSKNSSNSDLVNTIDTLETNLNAAIAEKDQFSILGIKTTKPAFRSLFWIITIGLAILLIILFLRMNSKISVAKEARKNFNNLEAEFEDFKKRSREKEQVLARQLQDEINKNI